MNAHSSCRCGPPAVAAAFACLLALAGPSSATLIDDFESGAFGMSVQPGLSTSAPTATSLAHCITSTRWVELTSNGPVDAFGALQLTVLDDEVTTVFPDAGGEIAFRWTPPTPVDLTGGGVFNITYVELGAAVAGGSLELTVQDGDGDSATATITTVGPATYGFPHNNWPTSLDLASVLEIELRLRTTEASDFHFRKIWTTQAAAGALMADALTPESAGPPYPAPELRFDVLLNGDITPPMPIAELAMILADVTHTMPGRADHRDIALLASDDGGMVGQPGRFGAISFMVSDETPFEAAPDVFRLRWLVEPDPEGPAAMAHLLAPPTLVQGPGTARMSFEVGYTDAAGGTVEHTTQHDVFFDVWVGQEIRMDSFEVRIPGGPTTGGAGFEIETTFEVGAAGAAINYSEPILVVSTNGEHNVTPLGLGVAAMPASSARTISLRALPSIMRTSTELRTSRPLERQARLDIVDVSGRIVRSMELPAGASSVSWDGRSSSAEAVAAGVYFVRLDDGVSHSSTRVVRLR